MTSPLSPEAVAQMVADLTHTDGPNGEMSMLYRGVIADALSTLAAENAMLRASEAAALDQAEKAEAELKDLIGAIVQVEGGLNRDCDMAWAGQIQDGAREHSRRIWGRFTAARDEVSAHTRFAWCAEIQADKARRRALTPTADKEPKT